MIGNRPARRSRRLSVGAGIAALGVQTLLVAACTIGPSTFDMNGTFTTSAPGRANSCAPALKPAATVYVYDTEGVSIGNGPMGDGTPAPGYRCAWPFTVANIPGNRSAYVIEVGKYGKITLPDDQARNPDLSPK